MLYEAQRANAAEARKARVRQALLTGPILRTLLKLGWPTIVVLVVQTLVGVAETYWVSFLGTAALAGVTLVFPISMLMTMMSNGGIGGGVASAVARAVGAGRRHDADALLVHALILAIGFGLLFTTGVLLLGPALYHALGGEGAAQDAAVEYSTFVFIGAVPAWVMNLFTAALRGTGNVRVPAILSMAGAAIMIPSSPAFIFGFGPIPRFGYLGCHLVCGDAQRRDLAHRTRVAGLRPLFPCSRRLQHLEKCSPELWSGGCLLGSFSMESATFAVVAFAILMGTFSISVSMGSDIRIITRTTTRISIHTLIKTTMRSGAWTILETIECLDQVT
jgi:MatE